MDVDNIVREGVVGAAIPPPPQYASKAEDKDDNNDTLAVEWKLFF